MASEGIQDTRREPVSAREGYQGKPIPPGAKPVKSAAADVPSKPSKDSGPQPSK